MDCYFLRSDCEFKYVIKNLSLAINNIIRDTIEFNFYYIGESCLAFLLKNT